MRPILPAWTEADADLLDRLGAAIDPERKVLEALERITPLSGRRIADVGTGIGHYPMLLARPAQPADRGRRLPQPAAPRLDGRHRAHQPHRA
jgi:hypothetical protein